MLRFSEFRPIFPFGLNQRNSLIAVCRLFRGLLLGIPGFALLFALNAQAASGPFVVQVRDGSAEARPALPHVYVQLSGRFIATDSEGQAVFEGLPAGRYALAVKEPGFAALGREIDVPAGQREPLELGLKRVTPAILEGRVLVEGLGQPIAGASLELRPSTVEAAIQGPGRGLADWEGNFRFPALPPGRYEIKASAPGFAPASQTVELEAPELHKQTFDQPQLDGAALDVCVTWGADCGKPAADAFCRAQGFRLSLDHHATPNKPPTKIIGSGQLCEASHCTRIDKVECAGRLADLPELKLQPISNPSALKIKIQDGLSGSAINAAKVTLAEAWPGGEIAQGQTTPQGEAAFDKLRLGAANWADKEGKVALSRRKITVRAEAEGYETRTVAASLEEQGSLDLKLFPVTPQPEQEPNDDLNSAQPVRTGAPVLFKFNRVGDHDFFKFRLTEPARLAVFTKADTPAETHLRLRDREGKLLSERGAYANQENRLELVTAAGEFFVEISEWGDNAANPEQELTLNLTIEPVVDPREPNDTAEQAVPVTLAEQMPGLIWPVGDHDFYRIPLPRPGVLRLREPGAQIERHVRLKDAEGKLISEQGVYAGQALDFQANLPAGVYLIEIGEWGDNNTSPLPYRLRADFLPDDGVDDPLFDPKQLRAVRTLPLGSAVATTLLPTGDQDRYALTIPGAGILRIHAEGESERHVQLFDRQGKLLTEHGAYANQPNDLTWHLNGPDTLYLNIQEWGNNAWSPVPYLLSAWLLRADEMDFVQRNEDFDRASPLQLGATVRGSYLPQGDHDVYLLESDFPGHLKVELRSAEESHLRIYGADRKLIQEQGVYANQTANLRPEVGAGFYYLMVGEWGDNHASPAPYELKVNLERGEPGETANLKEDPPRRLTEGVALAFTIDHLGDRDRFLFEAGAAGDYTLRLAAPVETLIRVFNDQTGERLHESGHYAPTRFALPLKLTGPTRLRVELSEWGDNNVSAAPGFVMIDAKARPLAAAALEWQSEAGNPRRVQFQMKPLDQVAAPKGCEIDLNGDGKGELQIEGETTAKTIDLPKGGPSIVEAICTGPDNQSSRQRTWVQPSETEDRAGLALVLAQPSEGQRVEAPLELRAQAISYDGLKVARVEFALDGKPVASDSEPPYEATLNWAALGRGKHELKVTALDQAGNKAEVKRNFELSDFFNLTPPDGAVLSGESVRVAWQAPAFGEARVRYRKKGEESWQEAVGQSGQLRQVTFTGLEATVPYEFQPLDGQNAGPLRTLTRVKGLAFGRPRYGANIRRDYDQRVGISVRNNGDQPLTVRLECGRPKDPLLLVGFVGDGSEDRPFKLGPGEEREFLLAISAQDVNTADHSFPVRIVADSGLNDEAEVAVNVKLPHVELVWQELGTTPAGGRTYRLSNPGDTVTDLEVTATDPAKVTIHPTVRHGLLPQGQFMDFTIAPQFYEGFKGVKTTLVANGAGKRFDQIYEMKPGPGESARRIWLFPGHNPAAPGPDEASLRENAQRGEKLKAEAIDWKQRENPEDIDGDGRMDRWSQVIDEVRWVGDDTDGDETVDFVHADVGDDGVFEYSALLENGKWRETNLVEAWLEMGFNLMSSRTDYKEHDVDVLLNEVVIGRLRDAIPEGNYAFPIPPRLLRFDASGRPGDNRVGIRSKHIRGGHYAVNSDFRFKFRLTATPVWTLAKSEAEARQQAAAQTGLTLDAPDLSISSADLRLEGPAEPKAGDPMSIEVPVRNLGAVVAEQTPLVLFRTPPSGQREELTRILLDRIPLHGDIPVKLPFTAPGGSNTLTLILDPDRTLKDPDPSNNQAVLFLKASGDSVPPTLKILRPAADAVLKEPLVTVEFEATDDLGPATPAISVNGGLWQPLPAQNGRGTAELLLQPGSHRIELRATDASGNVKSEALALKVEAPLPTARLLAPQEGANIDQRSADIRVETAPDTALFAARVAGGPWYKGGVVGNEAKLRLPLGFGPQTIEVMIADKQGTVAQLQTQVTCTRQPADGEKPETLAASDQGLLWPANRPDLEIDLFKQQSGLLAKLQIAPKEQAQRLRDDARRRQAQGDYLGAYNKYRESLLLEPDAQVQDRVKKLEVYLEVGKEKNAGAKGR